MRLPGPFHVLPAQVFLLAMIAPLEVLVVQRAEAVELRSPGVGTFTRALPKGRTVDPGQSVGVLTTLGRARELRVPAGVAGRIASTAPERVLAPVGYGELLYELHPLEAGGMQSFEPEAIELDADGLCVRVPQTGRFWRRAAPADPPLAAEGDVLQTGSPMGLIEVMKTFTHVVYAATKGLPPRARIVRFAAQDGQEVTAGQPLIVIEKA